MKNTIQNYKNIFGILMLTFTMVSCEDLVTEVDIPDYDAKLVVQSFISPDEPYIKVTVSESIPVFSASSSNYYPEPLIDAEVYIRGEGKDIYVPYSEEDFMYKIKTEVLDPQPGKSYSIDVTSSDGRKVSGSCTIPNKLNTSLEVTDVSLVSGDYSNDYDVSFKFTDTPGEGDRYRVYAMATIQDSPENPPYLVQMYLEKGETYISDENRDGSTFSFRGRIYAYYGIKKVEVMLLTTDENYYTYHKSLENNYGDDPFSEPMLVYSNIDGGLGIFSGFRTHTVVYDDF